MKNSIIISLLFLSTISLFAQSEISTNDYFQKGISAFERGDYEDALSFFESIQNDYGENIKKNEDVVVILDYIAFCYSKLDDNQKAVIIGEKALTIQKSIQGEKHPDTVISKRDSKYVLLLNSLAGCYALDHEYSKATELGKSVLGIIKKHHGEKSSNYVDALNNLAYLYEFLNIDYSINLCQKALTNERKYETGDTIRTITNLAYFYHQQALNEHELENDSTAFLLTNYAIELLDNISKNTTPLYAICKHDAGMFALTSGVKDSLLFINNMLQAIDIKEKIYGKTKDYYWSVECFADGIEYLAELSSFPRNIDLYEKAIGVYERIPEHELFDTYRTSLGNLSVLYQHVNINKAIELGLKKLSIERKYEIGDSILSMSNLAAYFQDIDVKKSLSYAHTVLEARENLPTPDYDKIRISHHRLAAIYCREGNLDKAIYHMTIAQNLADSLYGESSIQYATSIQNLGVYYLMKGDTAQSLCYLKKAYTNQYGDRRDIANNLAAVYSHLNEVDSCYKYTNESWELSCSNFIHDIYIMSKDNRFTYILTDRNNGMITTPINYMLCHKDNPKLKRLAFESALFSIDILTTCMDDKNLKSYNLHCYEEVKSMLKDGEVAIQIWDDKFESEGRLLAFIIRNNYEAPTIVELSKDRIKKSLNNDYPTTPNSLPLFDNIWKDLIEAAEIEQEEKIYISLDGILTEFPIEFICGYDWVYVDDKYDIIRLTSIKGISKQFINENANYIDAVLYGGLKYDSDVDYILNESLSLYKGKRSINENLFKEMSESTFSAMRSSTKYLPWTKTEIDSISVIIQDSLESVKIFEGGYGIEETFKALSGESPSIVHIATHGYIGLSNEIMDLWNIYVYFMENTGLLFSGVLNTAMINTDTLIVEDGILRSSEISSLDFRNTKLLVLSACSTGIGGSTPLGKIGLLRAFKAAGVGSIIMTLRDVDDSACYFLMKNFYKFLIYGYTARDSLKMAQIVLRKSEEFKDFNYWAYFSIID